jgi:hypothetical protein
VASWEEDTVWTHAAPRNHENWPHPLNDHDPDGGNVTFCNGYSKWIGQAKWNYRYALSKDPPNRQLTPF